jgi:hypothetical protein
VQRGHENRAAQANPLAASGGVGHRLDRVRNGVDPRTCSIPGAVDAECFGAGQVAAERGGVERSVGHELWDGDAELQVAGHGFLRPRSVVLTSDGRPCTGQTESQLGEAPFEEPALRVGAGEIDRVPVGGTGIGAAEPARSSARVPCRYESLPSAGCGSCGCRRTCGSRGLVSLNQWTCMARRFFD